VNVKTGVEKMRIIAIKESNGYKLLSVQTHKTKRVFFCDYNLVTNQLRFFDGSSFTPYEFDNFKGALKHLLSL